MHGICVRALSLVPKLYREFELHFWLCQSFSPAHNSAHSVIYSRALLTPGEQAASQPEAPETPQEAAAEPAAEPAAGAAAAQDDDAMQDGPSDDGAAPQG